MGLGVDCDLFDGFHTLVSWKENVNRYADYKPADFEGAQNRTKAQLKLPNYNLWNAGLYRDFHFQHGTLRLQLNVDNLLDTAYLSRVVDNNPLGTTS